MPEIVPGRLGGARAPRRDVHFFWLLDGSTSMQGMNIQSLNFAVANAIPEMRIAAGKHPRANVVVRALKFADGVDWVVREPTPISSFVWHDIDADGETAMGEALAAVAEELEKLDTSRRFFPPVLILVTDGYPTDDFDSGLRRLLAHPLGRIATRLAVAIGQDVGPEGLDCLRRFIGNEEIQPLRADTADQLARQIVIASVAAIEISSKPDSDPGAKVVEAVGKGTGDDWTWGPQ